MKTDKYNRFADGVFWYLFGLGWFVAALLALVGAFRELRV